MLKEIDWSICHLFVETNMGFLKKLFGNEPKEYVDNDGIYFYAQCNQCNAVVKVRASKHNDLSRTDGGFVWHKTIVDNRCFRRMQAVVYFDGRYNVTDQQLTGGEFVTEAEYETQKGAR
jgi:hypothetical protein